MTLDPIRLDLSRVLGAQPGLFGIPCTGPCHPLPTAGVALDNRERTTQTARYVSQAALGWRCLAVEHESGE